MQENSKRNSDLIYLEIYIDNNSIYTYNDSVGLKKNVYVQEGNKLFYIINNEKIEFADLKQKANNDILFTRGANFFTYRKITDKAIKLNDFIDNDKSENEYLIHFYERELEWKNRSPRSR